MMMDDAEATAKSLTPYQAEIMDFPLRVTDWRETLAFRFHLGAHGVNAVRQLVDKGICEERVAPWWRPSSADLRRSYRLTAFGVQVRKQLRAQRA